MKVIVDGRTFDSDREPIIVTLNSEERELVRDASDQTKICLVPTDYTYEDVGTFMKKSQKTCNWVDVPPILLNFVLPGLLFLILLTIILH